MYPYPKSAEESIKSKKGLLRPQSRISEWKTAPESSFNGDSSAAEDICGLYLTTGYVLQYKGPGNVG